MMVLPVTCATASMTWPISTSRKLGVMRWPWLWALTRPAAVNDITSSSRPARTTDRVIAFSTPAPRRVFTVILFICLFFLFVPGHGIGRRLVHRNHAIPTRAELFCFIGNLCQVEHQFLLPAISRHADTCIGRRIECREDFLGAILVIQGRAIDSRDQVAGAQADSCECLPVGARIDPKAPHLAAREHRLGTQH